MVMAKAVLSDEPNCCVERYGRKKKKKKYCLLISATLRLLNCPQQRFGPIQDD